MSILGKAIVLELNQNWQRTKWRTVQDAIVSLGVALNSEPNMLAIPVGPDGIEGHPITWDEWIKLPVRSCDLAIKTKNGPIRAPLVIIAPNHAKMPVKAPQLSNEAILARDGLVDQYTGEQLTRSEANVDHIIPKKVWRERKLPGSPNRWDNMVTTRNKRNFNKGSKMNFQVGYKLIRKPKAPKAVPVHFIINKPMHEFQVPFFEHMKDGK